MMGKQKDAKKKPSKGNKKNNEKGPKKDVDVQAVSDRILFTHIVRFKLYYLAAFFFYFARGDCSCCYSPWLLHQHDW